MWSHDRLNTLYLYYRKVYDNKIWQGDELLEEVSTHKVEQSFKHVET